MPKTSYKVVPPESKELLPGREELMTFTCGDCKTQVQGADLVEHAQIWHFANTILVDTTINWGEIARKKEQEDGN